MAAIAFTDSADGIFIVRKSLYRMIVSRTKATLDDPDDIREMETSLLTEGISLYYLAPEQRLVVASALLRGATQLRDAVYARRELEEPVGPGTGEYLDSFTEFIDSHLRDERVMSAAAVPYPYGDEG